MSRLLQVRNDILVEEVHEVPINFGEDQAQKDLNQFEKNLIEIFNRDDCEEYHQFLEELDELHSKVESGDLSDFVEL